MLQVLKLVPAYGVLRPAPGLGPVRSLLRAVLLYGARFAVRLAARLEEVEVLRRSVAEVSWSGGSPAVKWAEAVVGVAVVLYFVVGLVGVFVS